MVKRFGGLVCALALAICIIGCNKDKESKTVVSTPDSPSQDCLGYDYCESDYYHDAPMYSGDYVYRPYEYYEQNTFWYAGGFSGCSTWGGNYYPIYVQSNYGLGCISYEYISTYTVSWISWNNNSSWNEPYYYSSYPGQDYAVEGCNLNRPYCTDPFASCIPTVSNGYNSNVGICVRY